MATGLVSNTLRGVEGGTTITLAVDVVGFGAHDQVAFGTRFGELLPYQGTGSW